MRVWSADKHLWQDAEKACQLLKRATGAIRSSKFWVRSSENLELRTSNLGRLAFPSVSRGDCAMSRRNVKNDAGEYVEECMILPDFCSHRAIPSSATLSLMPEPQASDLFPRCDGGQDGLSC